MLYADVNNIFNPGSGGGNVPYPGQLNPAYYPGEPFSWMLGDYNAIISGTDAKLFWNGASGPVGGVGAEPANNDSWGWTFTKSFFSGFSLFGPKNDPRPSCFGNFVKNSVANFVGIPGIDTVGGGAAAYYGVSLSQAQAIPNTRVARGGISPSQWLEADEAARLANAGKFSLALNAVVAEGQALASEVPSALSGECK